MTRDRAHAHSRAVTSAYAFITELASTLTRRIQSSRCGDRRGADLRPDVCVNGTGHLGVGVGALTGEATDGD